MRRFGFALLLLFSLTALGQNVPVPFIDQPLSPTTALPGSQGFTLTVHGANFAPTAVLEWNGSQRRTVVVSSALLQATINTSDLTTAETAFVTVVNLATSSRTSNTALFTIRKPAPAVAFAPDPYFSAGSAAASVVGDFNNDGIPDVATCGRHYGGSVINVYFGEGQGKFQPPIKSVFTENLKCSSLIAADFNGDHLLDLAVISQLDAVGVWFGDGKGKFTKGGITGIGHSSVYGVADVNADGILDLLVAAPGYQTSGTAGVLFGTGDGTFYYGSSISAKIPGSPVLGDFNEDGYLDLAVPDLSSGTVEVALNQGNGTFSNPVSYPLSFTSGIATADVNNDGHLDIISDTAAVLLGKGDGTFTSGEGAMYSGYDAPMVADFNGDRKVDLLFAHNATLLLGNGDGTFQPPVAAANGLGLGVSDFNHDGHLDVVDGGAVMWQVSAGLYPSPLNYAPQNVGTSSPPQTANLYNAGSTPLNLTSIHIGGTDPKDYSQTNNCPNSIPVGGSCQIQVVFTPTAVGNRLAKLIVAYTGFSSPQSVVLSGQGVGTTSVSLTPSSLNFGKQLLNTTSTAQTATLTNTGSNPVTVSNINTSGLPFAQTNNCPSTLLVGKSCQIQVTFSPTQNGTANGTLSVTDNASNSPQTVALSGLGTTVTFKPIGVNFGDQKVGTKSATVPITFTNDGTVTLNISKIAFGGANPGDFSQTNDCPSTLPAGSDCTIKVAFKPTQKGTRSADLQVSDDANPSPQQAAVGGTGT
jgi:hypothetical protein